MFCQTRQNSNNDRGNDATNTTTVTYEFRTFRFIWTHIHQTVSKIVSEIMSQRCVLGIFVVKPMTPYPLTDYSVPPRDALRVSITTHLCEIHTITAPLDEGFSGEKKRNGGGYVSLLLLDGKRGERGWEIMRIKNTSWSHFCFSSKKWWDLVKRESERFI